MLVRVKSVEGHGINSVTEEADFHVLQFIPKILNIGISEIEDTSFEERNGEG